MSQIEAKIDRLKKIHARSAPEAKRQIEEWEEKMVRLKAQKEWLEHPNTRQVVELCVEQIESIDAVLTNDENLSEMDRRAMFREKNAHQSYLSALTADPTSAIASIEDAVDHELKEQP